MKRGFFWLFPALIAVVVGVLMFFNLMLKPLLSSIAEAKVRLIATQSMNESILANLTSDVTYDKLMNVVVDEAGRVTMIQANSALMNRLGAQIALDAQKNIANINVQSIGIPIGTVIGGSLFSGRGPLVKLSAYPVGSVMTSFVSKFEDAGINQTLHKINLKMTATVRIIIPGGGSTVQVDYESPVTESIIVGMVPQTFIDVPKDEVLNLVPIE